MPNYLINLLLFLNKSLNLIYFSEPQSPYKKRIVDTIRRFCSNLSQSIISEGDEIVRACERHRNETVTLKKHATKHKCMRKWMVELLIKSQSCGIKFSRVNSIRMTKSIYFNFL